MNRVLGDRFTGEESPALLGAWVSPGYGFTLANEFAGEMNATCGSVPDCDVALKNYKPGKCSKPARCPRMVVPRLDECPAAGETA